MARKRKASVLEDNADLVGGSSAGASSAPTTKRARKIATTTTIIPEKRAARVKTTCPKNIQERVARVMSQRYTRSPVWYTLIQVNQIFYDRTRENPK